MNKKGDNSRNLNVESHCEAKENVDIYIYIDLKLNEDELELVQKCIKIHLQAYYKNYIISKMICCNDLVDKTETDDVIKNGLLTFHNMFRYLKLKGREPVWFIYLSNGDIQDKYKDSCVLLLNTQPNKKECYYCVHATPFQLRDKTDSPLSRDNRIMQFKNLNINLKKLFSQIGDEKAKKIYY